MRLRTIHVLALLCLSAGFVFAQNCRFSDGSTYTTLELTSSVNSPVLCQAMTLTATITATDATPSSDLTGIIEFFDGTVLLAAVPVSGGSASFTVSSFTLGTHVIQARYNPDVAVGGSSSTLPLTVSGSAPVILSSAPNPSNSGQAVTFTVRVAAAACQGVPPPSVTGTISFFDGATQIGQANVVSGTATLQSSTLASGSHALNARYSGDINFGANTSNIATQMVNGGKTTTATTTALTPSANPIATAQPLTLVATVTPSGATGQVQFRDGATVVGTAALSGGAASFTPSNLTAGTHPLTAVYLGDTNFNTSTSATVNETVTGPGPGPSAPSTTLSVSPNPAGIGQTVTLSATVTPTNSPGSVQFFDGSTPLGQSDAVGGVATFKVSTFTAGTHALSGRYLGDTVNPPSTASPVTLTVTTGKQNTTTSLSGSNSMITSAQPLTLIASVTPAGATGNVRFDDGGSPLGIVALSNGAATLTISSLLVGTHSLSATYMGDENFNPSTYPASSGPSLPFSAVAGLPAVETAQRAVKVQSLAAGEALRVTVLPLPSVSISVPTVSSTADQPAPQVTLSPAYALPLKATFTLSFTPGEASPPANYSNPGVTFIGGSTTSPPISIPADSSEPVLLPAVQLGTVAGTITVKLTALTTSTGQSALPASPPTATIPVGKFVPSIVPGSVRIVKNAASGFTVFLDASSTTCDLTGANLTFGARSGARWNEGRAPVSLTAPAASWLPGTAATCGMANGGAFSVAIPFTDSVDTIGIGTVSVTLTNLAGTSTAVSGGR